MHGCMAHDQGSIGTRTMCEGMHTLGRRLFVRAGSHKVSTDQQLEGKAEREGGLAQHML